MTQPPSMNGRTSFLVAVGLFLAEHGYNAQFDGCGSAVITLNNKRFAGSLSGPLKAIVTMTETGHHVHVLVGDSLQAYTKSNIDLYEPDSFDKLIRMIKQHEQS